jgi:hypothetical protein
MTIIALCSFETGTAQVPWACATTRVCNLTNCSVRLTLITTPMGAVPPINLMPGQCLSVPTPVASIDRVVGAAGGGYPILPPPPVAPCNCPLGLWSVCCVTLPPQNCCFDICFDQTACTIFMRPAACPAGTCRP